jgi:hypothetical protein
VLRDACGRGESNVLCDQVPVGHHAAMNSTSPRPRAAPGAPGGDSRDAACDARWPYLAVGTGAAIFFYLHLFRFPFVPIWHWGDQSIFLDHAEHMLRGEVLYRNLFQFNLPGTEYLYYFLFLCFGVRMWIAPLAVFITLTVATLLVYSLSRTVLRGPAALLPAIAFAVVDLRSSLDGAHHLYSTVLVFLAVNLIARARSSFSISCAGAVLGVSALFTSSRGVFVAIGVSLFFIWKLRDWRKASQAIVALLAPFVAVIAAMLAYLATTVAPYTLFESLVVFPLRYYPQGRFNTPAAFFAELSGVLPLRAYSVLPVGFWLASKALAPALLIAFLVSRFLGKSTARRESPSHQILVLCFLAGCFALIGGTGSLSLPRMNCAVAFAYILGTAMLVEIGQRRLIAGLIALMAATACVEMAVATMRPAYIFEAPRGSIFLLNRDRYELISWLSRNGRPGDQLFGDPDLNFVLNFWNPAGVQWVEPGAFTRPEQVRGLLTALEQNRTRFIIWSAFVEQPGPGDNLWPLRAYLNEHYHPAISIGVGAEVLVANTDNLSGK